MGGFQHTWQGPGTGGKLQPHPPLPPALVPTVPRALVRNQIPGPSSSPQLLSPSPEYCQLVLCHHVTQRICSLSSEASTHITKPLSSCGWRTVTS